MDRDEQVGLYLARFLDAHIERQEVVAVAREQGAHVRLGIDQGLQPPRDHQRDVLLARAAAAERARILAAVAGVDDDGGEPRHLVGCGGGSRFAPCSISSASGSTATAG